MKNFGVACVMAMGLCLMLNYGCKKSERQYVGDYRFMVIKSWWKFTDPAEHIQGIDTLYYDGTVDRYEDDSLRIQYLSDSQLEVVVDEEGSFTSFRASGAVCNLLGCSGGFSDENNLAFSLTVNHHPVDEGSSYEVTAKKE